MSVGAPIEIPYAPPLPWYRTPQARRILCYSIAILVLAAGIIYWPLIKRLGPRIYWENRCLNYRAPSGTICYSNDPQDIARLAGGGNYVTAVRGLGPGSYVIAQNREFQQMVSAQAGRPSPVAPAIFLHLRRTPSGVSRLVAVQFSTMATPNPWNRLFLHPYVHQTVFGSSTPAGKTTGQLEMCLKATDRVRLYDGQPDPADESAFTIDYDLNGQRGTIDGKLGDDGAVTLTPRTGRFAVVGGTGWWSPGGAPMPHWLDRIAPPATTQSAR